MVEVLENEGIRVRSVPVCVACGGRGLSLYTGLSDRVCSVPGKWSISRCADPACGLLWMDPMPMDHEILKLYPEDYYTKLNSQPQGSSRIPAALRRAYRYVTRCYLNTRYGYETRTKAWQSALGRLLYLHPARRAIVDVDYMYLPATPNGRLLDVGCGNGDVVATLNANGWRAEGVDVDPAAVELARRRGLSVKVGSLQEQGYPEASFDAVIHRHVIEHVPDPLALLAECQRILKPGGLLVSITPNALSWGHRRFGRSWFPLEPPRHLYVFTVPALINIARHAGFDQLRVHTSLRMVNELFRASRMIASTGRFQVGSTTQDLGEGRWRSGYPQWLDWLLLRLNPWIGEEIVLMGRKP